MKVRNITYYNTLKPAFKKHISSEDCYDDYGIYNNHMSIKDIFVSSTIVSGLLLVVGSIFTHKDKFIDVFKKKKDNIKTATVSSLNKVI